VFDNVGVGQNWDPVVLTALWSFDAIHAETARQTGDTTENGLERFGQVVRDEIPGIVSGAIVQLETDTYSKT
jgi:hypothetical protein